MEIDEIFSAPSAITLSALSCFVITCSKLVLDIERLFVYK
jgi:hypothetical protein